MHINGAGDSDESGRAVWLNEPLGTGDWGRGHGVEEGRGRGRGRGNTVYGFVISQALGEHVLTEAHL